MNYWELILFFTKDKTQKQTNNFIVRWQIPATEEATQDHHESKGNLGYSVDPRPLSTAFSHLEKNISNLKKKQHPSLSSEKQHKSVYCRNICYHLYNFKICSYSMKNKVEKRWVEKKILWFKKRIGYSIFTS